MSDEFRAPLLASADRETKYEMSPDATLALGITGNV